MKCSQLRGISMLAVAVALSFGSGASAFVPVEDSANLEIRLPEFETRNYMNAGIAEGMLETQQTLAAGLGGQWQVRSWNSYANSPHSVFGSGAEFAAPFSSALDVEYAAREFVATYATALKVEPENLRLDKVSDGMGKYAAHFKQTYGGYDVIGGRVHAVFTESGRLFVMGSDFYQIEDLDTTPTLSEQDATQIAISDLPFDPAVNEVRNGTDLVVLPVPLAVNKVAHHLVYRLRVETTEPLGVWVTHVDAHSGEILWRYNDVHFFSGETTGDISPSTYCEGDVDESVGHNTITVDGNQVTSDSDGLWTAPGSGSAAFSATLDGPYCGVDNIGSGGNASFGGTVTDGANDIEWNDTNSRADERDVFESISDVHDFIETFDPGFGYSNQFMDANVNRSQTCNAYWDGSINFYNAGGGCANTGEIQGVAHHEFGHGVQWFIIGGQGNEGLGEGNSDVLANFVTDEPIIGRGFYLNQCNGGIRNSENARQYPESLGGGVHSDGEIMAGVVWDVRKNLELTLGAEAGEYRAAQLWHFGRILEQPTNQADQVFSMFVADDDNGDLSDGTPHYAEICVGARKHDTNENGYDCPTLNQAVTLDHTQLTTPQSEGSIDFVATASTTSGSIDQVTLYYNRNGNDFETAMAATGNPNEYSASVALSEGDQVIYYILASDTGGNTAEAPTFAPFFTYAFDLPTIWDPIETDEGWSVNDEGTDDASTGEWERVDPVGTGAQPEDDNTVDGTICWITGQQPGGGTIGTNDVDDGSTSLYSPTYDLSSYETVTLKYFRWYSNTGGSDPNNDIWITQARNDGGPWVDIENNQSDQNQWFPVQADLIALLGTLGDVEFKFIASDLNDGSIVEAGVDDFEILAGSGTTDAPEISSTPRFALYGARPNPIQSGTAVSFQVPTSMDVAVVVYDVAGRTVATVADGQFEAGLHSVEWDGRDDRNNAVASGVYYVRMQANEFTASRSIVISR